MIDSGDWETMGYFSIEAGLEQIGLTGYYLNPMKQTDSILAKGRGEYWYYGKSAWDRYRKNRSSLVNVATTATLAELAADFDGLTYPGVEGVDALYEDGVRTVIFLLVDSEEQIPSFTIAPLNILYRVKNKKFIDRRGEYESLRNGALVGVPRSRWDWEHLLRAMAWRREDEADPELPAMPAVMADGRNRFFLADVLTGPRAHVVLDLLYEKGWIDALIPELGDLAGVEQNKEFHPEGNVWEHTLETLKYRKERSLSLSLALLFHDTGKAGAEEVGGNRFHGHAQIGGDLTRSILRSWDFPEGLIDDVTYLVSHHMMPAAIDRLPYYKKKEVIEDPLFPELLELYRCDLSSSFNGLDGYYNACRYYKGHRKNKKNPYREADGSLVKGGR